MGKNKILFLMLFIIIFVIILIIIINSIKTTIELNKLSNMYKDIDILEDKISIYYLNNGILPTKSKIEDFLFSVNPNDNDNYYEIDLDKLENINLYFGKKKYSYKDIYIINEQSHTIYYYAGIKYKDYNFFSKELNYINIDIENYR